MAHTHSITSKYHLKPFLWSDLGHDPETHDSAVWLGLVAAGAMVAFFIFEKVCFEENLYIDHQFNMVTFPGGDVGGGVAR